MFRVVTWKQVFSIQYIISSVFCNVCKCFLSLDLSYRPGGSILKIVYYSITGSSVL